MSQSPFMDRDLGISQQVHVTQQITSIRIQPLTFQYEFYGGDIFLLFTVVNAGSELKKITLCVQIDEYSWERVFCNTEHIYDVYYDFNLENVLILPLEGLSSFVPSMHLRIDVTLEYFPSIIGINAQFDFNEIIIREILEIAESDILIMPDTFKIRLKDLSFFQKRRFVLNSIFLTRLPINAKLYSTLLLNTNIEIETLTLIGTTLSTIPQLNPLIRFTLILDKNFTEIGIKIFPSETSDNGEYTIKISVHTVDFQTNYIPNFWSRIDIPDHPIPEEIMAIFFTGVLFGVPLYVIYKEQETNEGKQIKKLGDR